MLCQQRLEVKHRGPLLSSLRDHTLFLAARQADSQQQPAHMAGHLFTLENTVRTYTFTGMHAGTHKHPKTHTKKLLQRAGKMSGRIKRDDDNGFDPYKASPFPHPLKQMSIQSFPHRQFPNPMIKLAKCLVCSQLRSAWTKSAIHSVKPCCMLKQLNMLNMQSVQPV